MTTITIERKLLEQALNVLTGLEQNYGSLWYSSYESDQIDSVCSALRAELAKPVEGAKPVAWMDDFGNAFPIGARKGAGSWMDAHQRNWKPLYLHPPTPAWHDAPTEPGLWLNSINHYAELVSQHWIDRGVVANSHARWYGPIQPDGEKS